MAQAMIRSMESGGSVTQMRCDSLHGSAGQICTKIGKNQDFDSALAKHIVEDEIEPRTSIPAPHIPSAPSAYTVSPAPLPAPFPDAVPRLGSRGSSNGNGRVHHTGTRADDDEEDDALADFL